MLMKENAKPNKMKLGFHCGILHVPEYQFGFQMCINN